MRTVSAVIQTSTTGWPRNPRHPFTLTEDDCDVNGRRRKQHEDPGHPYYLDGGEIDPNYMFNGPNGEGPIYDEISTCPFNNDDALGGWDDPNAYFTFALNGTLEDSDSVWSYLVLTWPNGVMELVQRSACVMTHENIEHNPAPDQIYMKTVWRLINPRFSFEKGTEIKLDVSYIEASV